MYLYTKMHELGLLDDGDNLVDVIEGFGEAKQDVLGPHVIVVEATGLGPGELDDLAGAGREIVVILVLVHGMGGEGRWLYSLNSHSPLTCCKFQSRHKAVHQRPIVYALARVEKLFGL